ncbi:MAG: hypothetical protein ACYDDZ_01295, partial [Acidimicrobiales bacterium]
MAIAVSRHALAMLAGALIAVGTMAGLIISVEVGLFGFQDTFNALYTTTSLIVDSAATVVLAAASFGAVARSRRSDPMRNGWPERRQRSGPPRGLRQVNLSIVTMLYCHLVLPPTSRPRCTSIGAHRRYPGVPAPADRVVAARVARGTAGGMKRGRSMPRSFSFASHRAS